MFEAGTEELHVTRERTALTILERKRSNLDCDGIPKRPAMFLNLWRYKVVIQPELEGSTQGYLLVSVEVLRVNSFTMKMEIMLEPTSNKLMVEHVEFDESNANVLERFYTSAGNHVKEILLKLNLPDHRSILTDSKDESFGSSPTMLSNSNFSKDPSKVTPIELTTFMVAVNNYEKSVNPLPFIVKKKKGKS
ncbi:hypothetical protein Tco_0520521 [Tanacetum coccineum]